MICSSYLEFAYKTIFSPWLIILNKTESVLDSKYWKKREWRNVVELSSTSVNSFESWTLVMDTTFPNISTTHLVFLIVRWCSGFIFIVHIDLWHHHRSFGWRGRNYFIGRNLVQVSQEEVPEWLLFKVIYSSICYHHFISTPYNKVSFRCVYVKMFIIREFCSNLINFWFSIAQDSNFLSHCFHVTNSYSSS